MLVLAGMVHMLKYAPMGYAHPDHIRCHEVSLEAFHAAGEARAYPEAGPAWPVAKLYAVAQIDDGQLDKAVDILKSIMEKTKDGELAPRSRSRT